MSAANGMRLVPRFAADVQPRMSLRQRGGGKLLGHLENEMSVSPSFSSRAEVEQPVIEYIHFYNFERISLKTALPCLKFGAGLCKSVRVGDD